jgi:hypothetical protein
MVRSGNVEFIILYKTYPYWNFGIRTGIRNGKIHFTTETDRCGANPKWDNFKILTNGKELTKNVECYWLGSVVTMGNDTYSYINNEWQRMVPTYKVGIKKEMRKFKYDIENSLDHIFARDFETDIYLISPSYAFADMIAVVNGHVNDPIIGSPHITTALIKGHQ